ncbi:hypothetical protein COL516b_011760 [Colletotrichum fioriniae]|nr:uncharacterized protein COL516b_011760 [Colletotrichum fioriniae]KAJ0296349.1 hypothetical protein COL516b_011760 [Colletotrichum fioriniae]
MQDCTDADDDESEVEGKRAAGCTRATMPPNYLGSCENHKAWYGKSASRGTETSPQCSQQDDSVAEVKATTEGSSIGMRSTHGKLE